jgi:hypothetical protein
MNNLILKGTSTIWAELEVHEHPLLIMDRDRTVNISCVGWTDLLNRQQEQQNNRYWPVPVEHKIIPNLKIKIHLFISVHSACSFVRQIHPVRMSSKFPQPIIFNLATHMNCWYLVPLDKPLKCIHARPPLWIGMLEFRSKFILISKFEFSTLHLQLHYSFYIFPHTKYSLITRHSSFSSSYPSLLPPQHIYPSSVTN